MDTSDLPWSASQDELKDGYAEKEDSYICLFCGKKIEKGIIYPEESTLYEAKRYIRVHIEKEHQSVFEYLINQDKRFTGLTDHQKSLLRLFYQGKSDGEIKKEMGIGSNATIRNHRFVLKEKERQAKVFLTLMELLKEKNKKLLGSTMILPHHTATMVDDHYNMTEDENEKILEKYFIHGLNGPIKSFDMKEKNKLVVLRQIAKRFEKSRIYSEKEINEILKSVYEDFVTLRRYLIEYGFMDRKPDGSQYWLRENQKEKKDEKMDRKKELKEQYKEMKTEAGVYQIKNTKNQKVLVVATPNLKTMNGRRMELQAGGHKNKQLQEEWKQFGEEAFVFEVLGILKEKEEGYFDKKEELKKLEEKWLEKLQPYGERGYHQLNKMNKIK